MFESNGVGRPTLFSPELCQHICDKLAEGKSLRAICSIPDFPSKATVLRWLTDSAKREFRDQYAQARRLQYQLLADELIELSDPDSLDSLLLINRNRLQIDTRKWVLSKVMPKEYGDKPEVEVIVDSDLDRNKLSDEELDQYIALLKKMKKDSD